MRRKLIKVFGLSIFVIFAMAFFSSVVLADTVGWQSPTSNFDNGVQYEDRAYTQNDSSAIFNDSNDDATYYGFGTNLVPAGAIIDGIEVRIDAFKEHSSSRNFDVRLYTGNTARGNTLNSGVLPNSDADSYIVMGSSTANWGYTGWDATNINTLRVRVDATYSQCGGDAYLDHIQIRVHYSYENFNITYNLDGGTNSINNPATYNVATPTINFEDATKAGYTFGGWFSDAEFTTEVTQVPMGSTGDVTLYAKWIQNTYNITYNLYGGINNVDNPATYIVTDPDIVLKAPTKVGYLFAGWYDNAAFTGTAVTTLDTAAAVDYTLHAKWLNATTGLFGDYNITYILNGGINNAGNPATYNEEDADIVLLAPTRVGYVFGGWFANAELTGTAVTTLDTAAAVDYTVYAKWVAAPVTVTAVTLPQTGQFPVLIGAISTVLFTGVGLTVLNKKR